MKRKPQAVWAIGLVASALILGSSGAAAAASTPPNGPGPRSHYTVQKQPAAHHCHYRYTKSQPLPDQHCTPGALNPKVTQATLAATICHAGYTTTIRPPTSITNKEKLANAKSYSYVGRLNFAEYDHLVSLELGGDPNDSRNLWVEPPSPGHKTNSGVHNPKDTVENRAKSLVCKHEVLLNVMQRAIATNWVTALAAVGHPTGR